MSARRLLKRHSRKQRALRTMRSSPMSKVVALPRRQMRFATPSPAPLQKQNRRRARFSKPRNSSSAIREPKNERNQASRKPARRHSGVNAKSTNRKLPNTSGVFVRNNSSVEIHFSDHSLFKIGQRKIPLSLVRQTVLSPDIRRQGHSPPYEEWYRRFGVRYLNVVVVQESRCIVVITAHWIKKLPV